MISLLSNNVPNIGVILIVNCLSLVFANQTDCSIEYLFAR